MLLVWTRLKMSNGRAIVPERQAGADSGRHSGLEDEIGPELLQAGLLSNSPANVIVNRYLVIEP